jgi:hypothetical protein
MDKKGEIKENVKLIKVKIKELLKRLDKISKAKLKK